MGASRDIRSTRRRLLAGAAALGFGAVPLIASNMAALGAAALVGGAALAARALTLKDAPPSPPNPARTEDTETASRTASVSRSDAQSRESDQAAVATVPEPRNTPAIEASKPASLAVREQALASIPGSTMDFQAFSDDLVESDDPIDTLKRLVGDIRTREAESATTPQDAPCDLERFAAQLLEEAGLFASDVMLPGIEVVRPNASRMVYLRCLDSRIPYLAKMRIIRLEAALNALRFATSSLDPHATMEEAYRLNQGLAHSIVAQATPIDEPIVPDHHATAGGEWAVRYGISQAIESLQLPYRLTAEFRCNVADGNIAIEFEHTPADVFFSSCWVDGAGIVPTTGDMRQRAAADYALRVALLLAASAFRCSERILHVWVAAVHENATRRTCYLSVDFDRWRFARLDLANLGDLSEVYRSFAPVLRYEDGWLRPVKQGFHLEEERFCPSRRYLPVSLSSRRLEKRDAERLGCDHVSALSIEEGDGRALVANAIMMRLAPADDDEATQKDVRAILELAGDDPDPTVRSAAERVVSRLVEGTLDTDPFAISEEFIRGDALTRANDRAKELLMQRQPAKALDAVAPLLARIDAAGTYDDSPQVSYRYFNSYVERALYNRLRASQGDETTVLLVPDAYYEAHMLVSVLLLMLGQPDAALAHAERLRALAPLDSRSHLHVVNCLDALDRDEEAIEQLSGQLELAHDPIGVGYAYYRMAFFQWKRGNLAAAQACYQLAMSFLPSAVPLVAFELSVLHLQHGAELSPEMTREEAERIVSAQGIPVSPTQETSDAFYECAQASLDAEIFPVARNFAFLLGAFTGDDIIAGLIRSLEDAPDH